MSKKPTRALATDDQQAYAALSRQEAELRATLYSIGDAVISTDMEGRVTRMNPVAERLTGWSEAEAVGRPLDEVFRIINEETRRTVESPVSRVLREGVVIGLANHTLLVARDGREIPIADAGAPIFDSQRNVTGVVLVFRDQTQERAAQQAVEEARRLAESIIATVREPLVVLDAEMRVVSANRAFYQTFRVTPEETEGRRLYDLGNGQWDIPALHELLEAILPQNTAFDDFEMAHDFPDLGRRTMRLNARRVFREAGKEPLILLAIEDITDRKRAEESLRRNLEQVTALNHASQVVTASLELDQVLAEIASLARGLTAAEYVSVVLLDEEGRVAQSTEDLPGVPAISHRIREEGLTNWIVRSGETALVDEIGADGTMSPHPGEGAPLRANQPLVEVGVKSLVGLPLAARGHPLGVLYLYSLRPHAFREQLPVLTGFANQAAIAIENARLYKAIGQELAERQRAETALRQSEERFRRLAENAQDLIYRYEFTPSRGFTYVSPAATPITGYTPEEHYADPELGLKLVHPEDRPLLEQYLQGGGIFDRPIILRWVRKDGQIIWTEQRNVPIYDESGRLIAMEGIARDITERMRHERELEAEAMLAQAVGESLEVAPLLERLLMAARYAVPAADKGSILLNEPDGRLRICALDGYHDARLADFAFGSDSGYAARAAHERRPLLIGDVRADPELRYNGEIEEARTIHSAIAAPLLIQDRLIGVIALDSTRKAAFSEQDLQVLTTFAATAALIVDNAHLFQETRQRLHEVELVAAVSAALRAADSRAEMIEVTLDQLITRLEIDGAAFESLNPSTGEVLAELGRGAWTSLTGLITPAGAGLSAEVLTTRQPYLNNDILSDPRLFQRDAVGTCRAAAAVPLIDRDRIVGLLWIGSHRPLGEDDLRLLTAIGDLVANGIRRATLQEEIQAQAHRMEQILDTVPEGVMLLDATGRVLQANPAARSGLAVLAGAGVGDVITRLGDRPLSELLTSPPTKGLWHEVRANGRVFEVIARPMENGPEPEFWVLVTSDVTREREARAQLQQQERLAAVGELAAGIAHDFNNLMTAIILYARMLEHSEGLSDRDRERVQVISQQGWHATRLIEQILDFSRRAVLERQPLDLLPLLKEHVKLLKHTLPENIEISLINGQDEYIVHADPTRIRQMVTNLAVNARDAMPEGGDLHIGLERITIGPGQSPLLPEMKPGDWIVVRMTDTGTGIPPEVLPRIFEPFFTTKGPGKGSGLGLAQVYGIVSQHEGRISVESQVGVGTTFTIYLPALTIPPAEPSPPEVSGLPLGHGETVLVVEDAEAVRAALVAGLEQLNYRPLAATNGRQALAKIEELGEAVALVLSDVVMPEMGGIALLHALREMGWQTPVILLTGHPLEKELETLRAEGMTSWLAKPPTLERLAYALKDALQSPRDGA